VSEPFTVGEGERPARLGRDPEGLLDVQPDLAPEPLAQAFAGHVRHREPEPARGFTGVVDRADMRVLQPGRGLDLATEPVSVDCRGQLGAQHLEGDGPLVLEVAGQVDRGHPAMPKLALEHIPVLQGGGEGGVGHVPRV
jgi:hypothetical protein